MSQYLNVISLEEAKTHLRVTHSDSDAEIRRMIRSALNMIEEKTCVLLYNRNKTYRLKDGEVIVHDGPIITDGTTGLATTVLRYDFSNYTAFTDSNTDNTSITLSVGYESPQDIPMGLLDAAFDLIDYWYYKTAEQVHQTMIPPSVTEVINTYTRFVM